MRRAIELITHSCVVLCLVIGCSGTSTPIAADSNGVTNNPGNAPDSIRESGEITGKAAAPEGRPDCVVDGVDSQSVNVFTERVREAPPWIQATLDREAQSDFDNATLHEVVASLREKELAEVPISIANRALASSEFDFGQRFSDQLNGIPLRLGLLRLLRRCGLVCDYRFEQFVITTVNDARTWTDRSGVNKLQPPPGSRWAEVLEDETGVECHDVSDMVEQLKIHYGVEVQLDLKSGGSTPRGLCTIHTARVPNRHWLRILLGRENLTCTLDGDTLLIKPLGD